MLYRGHTDLTSGSPSHIHPIRAGIDTFTHSRAFYRAAGRGSLKVISAEQNGTPRTELPPKRIPCALLMGDEEDAASPGRLLYTYKDEVHRRKPSSFHVSLDVLIK